MKTYLVAAFGLLSLLVLAHFIEVLPSGVNDSAVPVPAVATVTVTPSPGLSPPAATAPIRLGPESMKTKQTLLVSSDDGKSWSPVADDLPGGTYVNAIDWYGEQMLVATENNGLLLSNNSLTQWRRLDQRALGGKVNAIAVDNGLIYAAPFARGLYVSMDRGLTFIPLNFDLPNHRVQTINILPGRVLVGTDDGLYSLAERSRHWEAVFPGPQINAVASNGSLFVAATQEGPITSDDHGKTWERVEKRASAHLTGVANGEMLVAYRSGRLIHSGDGGESWLPVEVGDNPLYELVKLGDNEFLLSGKGGLYHSASGGRFWALRYAVTEDDMPFFTFSRKEGKLYAGLREGGGC